MQNKKKVNDWSEEPLRHLNQEFREAPKEIATKMVNDGGIVRLYGSPVTEELLWATIRLLASRVRELEQQKEELTTFTLDASELLDESSIGRAIVRKSPCIQRVKHEVQQRPTDTRRSGDSE